MIITKAELSRELGVSKARVSQYIREGLPVRDDGKIEAEAAFAWVAANVDKSRIAAAQDPALNRQRVRLMEAKAEALEIKNAIRRGDLVKKSDVLAELQDKIIPARSKLLAIPDRAAPQLANFKSPQAIEHLLTRLFKEALEELESAR